MPEQTAIDRRPRLNRTRVLKAALAVADEVGTGALTMRGLGKRLGVEAMSLYNHVADKEDVLAGIVDLVFAEIELPPRDLLWDASVRRFAISAYETMLRHPWCCPLVMNPPAGARPSRLLYIEALLRTFNEADFSEELTYRAYHAVDSHVFGFTMWEVAHSIADVTPELADQLKTLLSAGEYPNLLVHARQHMSGDNELRNEFEFGLDLILEGLNRLHVAQGATKRTGTQPL